MRYLIVLLALLLPSVAQAEWLEASSAHFVVYADDSEKDIRTFSEQLERYHEAMAVLTGLQGTIPSPSNRVTVFVVKNPREVQQLAGSRHVYGFYIPRAGGSVAYVPRVNVRSGEPDFSMIALLHEYAHHFLISNSSFPSPRWFDEGGAEFFASAEFLRDGSLGVGRPATHRAGELFAARNVAVRELVDADAYSKRFGGRSDTAFYGKSWLLYHYLTFSPDRNGQLKSYLQGLANGKSSRNAAEEAFGDLSTLEGELQRYLTQRTMKSITLRPDQIRIAPVAVRRISEGEAAIMPVHIRSRRGVNREQALELLKDARVMAARYSADAAVLAALAEAEFDAGNDAEAIAAADAALAIDPQQVNAYVQKGYALFRRASEAEDSTAAYKEALAPFLALNKLENDHPLPLIFYHRSFVERGLSPPEQAKHGLERAAELAPFDLGLRQDVAASQIEAGDFVAARSNLVPIAFNPHGGRMAELARQAIERIDAGGEPRPQDVLAILNAPQAEEESTS
jgi:tetratricopeptide (TPR) repeat protein